MYFMFFKTCFYSFVILDERAKLDNIFLSVFILLHRDRGEKFSLDCVSA